MTLPQEEGPLQAAISDLQSLILPKSNVPVAEREVHSLVELLVVLEHCERQEIALERFQGNPPHPRVVYRGIRDFEHPLQTTLDRLVEPGKEGRCKQLALLEQVALREFANSIKAFDRTPLARWELMTIAAHHGAPTRFLDWTFSPLVAAHFATNLSVDPPHAAWRCTQPPAGQDGGAEKACAVWRLNWVLMHKMFEPVRRTLRSTPREEGDEESYARPLTIQDLDDPKDPVTNERRPTMWDKIEREHQWQIAEEDAARNGKKLNGSASHFAFLFQPPAIDDRVTEQSAAFTVCSQLGQDFEAFLRHEYEHAADRPRAPLLTKIVIQPKAKETIRTELDKLEILQSAMFPDLDGAANELNQRLKRRPRSVPIRSQHEKAQDSETHPPQG